MTPTRIGDDRFETLVRTHHDAVYRAAWRVTRDADAALDVSQQVFLRIVEGRLELAGADDEGGVLRWWAVRIALAHARRARNHERQERSYAMRRESNDAGHEHLPERSEERQLLQRLVAGLPEDLRLPLELRFRDDWTYAAIGTALEVSEPTAHERVHKALERLRRELGKLGLGAYALQLEHELALDAAVALPQGLATQLLALHKPTLVSGFLSTGVIATLAGLVLVAAGALWFAGQEQPELAAGEPGATPVSGATLAASDEERAREALATETPSAGQPSRAGRPRRTASGLPLPLDERQPVGTATLTGRVTDAVGLGVGEVGVHAGWPSKGAMLLEPRAGTTRPDGRFEIEVELHAASEQIEVRVEHPEWHSAQHPQLLLRVGERRELPTIVVARTSDDPAGEFTLALELVGPDQRPVAGLTARLFRPGKNLFGQPGEQWEAGGQSDAFGRLELAGQHLGSKLLVIEGPAQGWRLVRERLAIPSAGRHARRVVLELGLVLAGRVTALDGTPLAGARLYAARVAQPEQAGVQAETDAQGRFRLIGLDPGACSLRVSADGCSPAQRSFEAGREDLVLRLKPEEEARDVGDHMAELHGRVRDARTAAPLTVPLYSIDVLAVESRSRAEFLAGEYVRHLIAPPVQIAKQIDGPADLDWREPEGSAFHRTGLDAGRYVIAVRAPGRPVAFAGPFELAEHALESDIVVDVEPPTRLRARLSDPDGAPVPGAWLVLLPAQGASAATDELDRELAENDGRPREYYRFLPTDAQGEVVVHALPPGAELRLAFVHHRFARLETEPLRVGPEGLELELAFARRR